MQPIYEIIAISYIMKLAKSIFKQSLILLLLQLFGVLPLQLLRSCPKKFVCSTACHCSQTI